MSNGNRSERAQTGINGEAVHYGGTEMLAGGHISVRPSAIRFLRLPEVIEVTGLGKTKIYELQAQGSFPRRVKITGHSVGWVETEVQAWLAQRVELSARPAANQVSPV
jgi:prophage regulatory protein